jgi:hypothetical protein
MGNFIFKKNRKICVGNKGIPNFISNFGVVEKKTAKT